MPETELHVITVRWQNRWFRTPLFSVQDGNTQRQLTPPKIPSLNEVHLRSSGAAKRFNTFLAESNLSVELANACASGETAAVLYDIGDGTWALPWELALEALPTDKARAAYTPARIVGSLNPIRPWKHTAKLRVLILEGFPGEVPNRIRPDLEAAGIAEAWEGLDPEVRARIEAPKRAQFDPKELSKLLDAERPHILWYCGHGRSSPQPGLLYNRDAWMSVHDFAAAIPKDSPPLCVALWACELGEASPDQDATAPAPQIHSALASRGVRGTLAMQSRINDAVARSMARELFNGFAIGLSLERAAARARRFGYALPGARLDWASPAVWLAQAPAKTWEWGAVPSTPLLERIVASFTVRQSQKTVEIDPRTDEAIQTAKSWSQHSRIVVNCDVGSESVMIALARIADAVFDASKYVPVFINMEKATPIASIRDWANDILSWCESELLPTALGQVIQFAVQDVYSTPRRLLELEDCMLVFINPPTNKDSDWFIDTLAASRRQAPIVLITDTPLPDSRFDNWTQETLMTSHNQGLLEEYLSTHPATVSAMAVVDLPLPEGILSAVGFSRELFPRGVAVLFETRFGPILADWARRMVLERISPDQMVQAHSDCVHMLRAHVVSRSAKLGREMLRHLVGAGLGAEALKEAAIAIETNYLDDRFATVTESFEILKPLGKLRRSLDTLALLRVADAYARIGRIDRTRLLLQDCQPENSLQQAVVFALRSEIEKNDGTPGWRERAIDFAARAIESAEKALSEPDLANSAAAPLMDYRMNLARLQQYLNYDRAAAATTYRELLKELNGSVSRAALIASIERNLSDCLLAGETNKVAAEQEVQTLLADADNRLSTVEPLRAEIAYVRAKLAESEGQHAYEDALQTCANVARQNGNGMIEAIADARIFWTMGPFDLDRWRDIEIRLAPYRHHGWAIRTAMNGRIRAAQVLATQQRRRDALELLHLNEKEIEAHPAYDRGSDKDRIAYTLAGILTLDPDQAHQQRASQIDWLASWLNEKHVQSLEEAWNGR